MSLNIKNLYPLPHPEVTYPEMPLTGRGDCSNEDENVKGWSEKKFTTIKKNKDSKESKGTDKKEAPPLLKLNIL